jgi:signal transduction histidine kinase/ActR/RegA family two-component response regulator
MTLAGGSAVAWLRARSMGVKLALLSALVTTGVVGVTFLALRLRANADVRRVFSTELWASQDDLRRQQDRNLKLLLATSSLVSTSPTLRAALQTWRVESNAGLPARADLQATIQREAERIFMDLDRDLLVVTDDEGRVLAAVGSSGRLRPGDQVGHMPAVRAALQASGAPADSGYGVWRLGGDPLQIGCVAILLEGYPVGALVLGERLERFLPRTQSAVGTHAVVTIGDRVFSSTLAAAPVGTMWTVPPDHVATTLPLGLADDGRPARLYLVRSLGAAVEPIADALGRSFLLAGVLAVAVVAGGAALVSRATLRPLSRFVDFLRAGGGAGAPARFTETAAPPEVGTLTDAYNRLIGSLGRQHAELEQRASQLSSVNAVLELQVRERQRAEQALRDSEDRLRQSQKLEALGTLAGGVAHDFNNLLSVIMGYAQLSAHSAPEGDVTLREDLAQITAAAGRASGLVRQLLAFSRKQVLQPQILDLNLIVSQMQAMLGPLIGEHIRVRTRLEPRLARIKADPSQIEQVVLNLVVNARDAMPGGGVVTIETANTVLDSRYADRPEAIPGGPAVMLAVSDTGVGMDESTRRRIFEPFFTTKAVGKGTGLGLSTVYGIVRQSEGSIAVFSEPGQGATFRCYFPAMAAAGVAGPSRDGAVVTTAGTESVLVVEDQSQLRAVIRRSLESRGYSVLEASHGEEALELAASHRGPIDLLVTDIVMPRLSGIELATRLRAVRPEIRVLFISGYSDEAIGQHGRLTPGAAFLQKPVQPDVLARVVREILDGAMPATTDA